jgi:hypothetical protein
MWTGGLIVPKKIRRAKRIKLVEDQKGEGGRKENRSSRK